MSKVLENRLQRIQWAIEKGYTGNIETGEVFDHKGKLVVKTNRDGYIDMCFLFNEKILNLLAHQFIYYLAHNTVVEIIDHRNRVRNDNRISNLRKSNHKVSRRNTNAKGYKKEKNGTFRPYIHIEKGKQTMLGTFKTEEEAIAVRKAAEIQYGYKQ